MYSIIGEQVLNHTKRCEPIVHANIPTASIYWFNHTLHDIWHFVANPERSDRLFTQIHLQIHSVEGSGINKSKNLDSHFIQRDIFPNTWLLVFLSNLGVGTSKFVTLYSLVPPREFYTRAIGNIIHDPAYLGSGVADQVSETIS
nr:unnamed protein product [Callosobruchus chinensis]